LSQTEINTRVKTFKQSLIELEKLPKCKIIKKIDNDTVKVVINDLDKLLQKSLLFFIKKLLLYSLFLLEGTKERERISIKRNKRLL
jgi:hypothetical protein